MWLWILPGCACILFLLFTQQDFDIVLCDNKKIANQIDVF